MSPTILQSAQETSTGANAASFSGGNQEPLDLSKRSASFFAQQQAKNDGPRFDNPASAAFFALPQEAQNLFAILEAAKNNGWAMGIWRAVKTNLKPLAGIGASLILALIAITILRSYIPETRLATIKNVIPLTESQTAENVALPISLERVNSANAGQQFALGPDTITTENAYAGEGITHLARRAVQERLATTHKTLSPQQLVFAEDFTQKQLGNYTLHPGESLSFAHALLDEAIAGAENLSAGQISSLTQWSNQVAEFNL